MENKKITEQCLIKSSCFYSNGKTKVIEHNPPITVEQLKKIQQDEQNKLS